MQKVWAVLAHQQQATSSESRGSLKKKSKTNNEQNLINDTILKKIALSQEHLYFWYFLYKYFLAQSLARIVYHPYIHLAFDFFLEGRARRNPK